MSIQGLPWWVRMVVGRSHWWSFSQDLPPTDSCWSAHRNLSIALFTQHHVNQLVMDTTSLELIQSRLPGWREEEYRHQLGSFGISGDLVLRLIALLSGGQKSQLAFALIVLHCSYIGSGSLGKGLCRNRLPLFQNPNGLWAHQISRDWVSTWLSVQILVDSSSHLVAMQSVWEV